MEFREADFTYLLSRMRDGDNEARARLFALVYNDLRVMARRMMESEHPGHTLQATALVHEAFLRFSGGSARPISNRSHFFALAARVMRAVLVDHARSRNAQRRGGHMRQFVADNFDISVDQHLPEILMIHEALERLSSMDQRSAQVVELRVFGGLREAEIARLLNFSVRTVKRDWTVAKAWLISQLAEPAPPAVQ